MRCVLSVSVPRSGCFYTNTRSPSRSLSLSVVCVFLHRASGNRSQGRRCRCWPARETGRPPGPDVQPGIVVNGRRRKSCQLLPGVAVGCSSSSWVHHGTAQLLYSFREKATFSALRSAKNTFGSEETLIFL